MTNKQEDDLKKEIEDKAIQITYPLAYKKGQEDERKRILEIINKWKNSILKDDGEYIFSEDTPHDEVLKDIFIEDCIDLKQQIKEKRKNDFK